MDRFVFFSLLLFPYCSCMLLYHKTIFFYLVFFYYFTLLFCFLVFLEEPRFGTRNSENLLSCARWLRIYTHTRLRARFPSDNLEKLPSCTALTKTTTKNNAQETLVSFFSLLVATLYSNKQADLMVVRILPAAVRVETTCLQLCDY